MAIKDKRKSLIDSIVRAARKLERLEKTNDQWSGQRALERHVMAILRCVQDYGERLTDQSLAAARRAVPHVLVEFDEWGDWSMRHIRKTQTIRGILENAECMHDVSETVDEIDRTIASLKRLRRDVEKIGARRSQP